MHSNHCSGKNSPYKASFKKNIVQLETPKTTPREVIGSVLRQPYINSSPTTPEQPLSLSFFAKHVPSPHPSFHSHHAMPRYSFSSNMNLDGLNSSSHPPLLPPSMARSLSSPLTHRRCSKDDELLHDVRLLALELRRHLAQTTLVDNRPPMNPLRHFPRTLKQMWWEQRGGVKLTRRAMTLLALHAVVNILMWMLRK